MPAVPAVPASAAALYPETTPFAVHAIPADGGHVLHVAEHGRPEGRPALVLHGGPGSGCSPLLWRVLDPQRWRIVCVDQRGAGLSRPRGAIVHNDTARLLADLRLLHERLRIGARWLVVGGSWGATLALLHAADAPQLVAGLMLRASFLARPDEIAAFLAPLGSPDAIARTFASGPLEAQRALARAWWAHEQRLATGHAPAGALDTDTLARQVDRYRVQSHYLVHGCWLGGRSLVERCADVPDVPTLLVHGDADRLCPLDGAQALQRALPRAALHVVAGAGHDPSHPGHVAAAVEALDAFAATGRFGNGAP